MIVLFLQVVLSALFLFLTPGLLLSYTVYGRRQEPAFRITYSVTMSIIINCVLLLLTTLLLKVPFTLLSVFAQILLVHL